MRLGRSTGGLVIKSLISSDPLRVVALVKSRKTEMWSRLTLSLQAEPPTYNTPSMPPKLSGLGLTDIPAPVGFLPAPRLSDSQFSGRLENLLKTLVADDAFSGAILVSRRGKPIFTRAYGQANRTYGVPNTPTTRFNLASITKMFTAVAIAQLVEQGKLFYSDHVGKILPDYPNADVAKRVTIHHLLSHTSGMIDAQALAEKSPTPASARTVDDHARPFLQEPLAFAPGERFSYSNAGYILLGKIIEKVSGQSFYDFVAQHVFRPAGMSNASFPELDMPSSDIATGYEDGPNDTRRDNVFDLTVRGSPAGMAYATVSDMDKFGQALISGRLVKPATLAKLWSGVTSNAEQGTAYGYGATIQRYAGLRIISHGGGWKGITNHFDLYPELGISVTIFCNIDNDPMAIADKIREWLAQGRLKSVPSRGAS
jgi:CubicO group peptidase (beta-lactamase class C family)